MAAAMMKRLIKPSTLSHPLTPISPTFALLSLRGFSSKLFVRGLSSKTTEDSLKNVFSEHGQVTEVQIMRYLASYQSKGYGFVTFASKEEADQALTEMNGKKLDGRSILVYRARKRIFWGEEQGPPENP